MYQSTFTDKTLECADCGQQFNHSAQDQQFYAERQFSEPRRCPTCRAVRKAARGDSGGSYAGGRRRLRRRIIQRLRRARDVHRHLRQLRWPGTRAVPADRLQARLLQRLLQHPTLDPMRPSAALSTPSPTSDRRARCLSWPADRTDRGHDETTPDRRRWCRRCRCTNTRPRAMGVQRQEAASGSSKWPVTSSQREGGGVGPRTDGCRTPSR